MITDNPFLRHTDPDRAFAPSLAPDIGQALFPEGETAEALHFIRREQLCDRALWAKFVEQFRFNSDGNTRGWRGEYWGKMMRGAAFVYSVTRDSELADVLRETVEDLLTVPDPHGRISTYDRDLEFNGWDVWARKYILLGLLCYDTVCEDEALRARMLTVMTRHADYILDRVGPAESGKLPICSTSKAHGGMNSLSILEPMVLLYRRTGEQRYLDFATYLVEEGAKDVGDIFERALQDDLAPYQYLYTKAYEMISCFEGLMEYALTTGSEKWKTAVIRFAYRAAESEISVIGSAGMTHEFFDHAAVRQTSARYAGVCQETCVSVTWMKFCSRLLLLTGDPLFGDCVEQTFYNAYLGSLNREKIRNPQAVPKSFRLPDRDPVPCFLPFDSYSPLLSGTRGREVGGAQSFTDGTYYGCCACIGSVGIGIAPHLAFLRAENGFSAQLYVSGSYRTRTGSGNPVEFRVSGGYPQTGTVCIEVLPEKPETFSLSLRIPSWSIETTLTLNGEKLRVSSGMTTVTREWTAGDRLVLCLDARTEMLFPTPYGTDVLRSKMDWKLGQMVEEAVTEEPEEAHHVAFRRGPLMLADDARLGNPSFRLPADPCTDTFIPTEDQDISSLSMPARVAVQVTLPNGDPRTLVDFTSAGNTWNETSRVAVWIATEN